jgi:hypothetical protein
VSWGLIQEKGERLKAKGYDFLIIKNYPFSLDL